MRRFAFLLSLILAASACGRLENVGKAPPAMTPVEGGGAEFAAMNRAGLPVDVESGRPPVDRASLWSGGRSLCSATGARKPRVTS